MNLNRKPQFMNGIDYLNHQQYNGESWGGMKMINRRLQFCKRLYNKDLYAHYGCVNAIEFSNDGEWLVSGGDDKRVLIWNVDKTLSGKCHPKAMKGEHNSNIFCLGFNTSHTKLFSAGNDEQVILHDVNTSEILDVFFHDEAVYGLSVDPVNENVFASACDDGRVLIWDIRQTSNDPFMLAGCSSAFHAVMYNPVEPRFVATANAKDGVCLWDVRKPKVCVMKYGSTLLTQSAMSVRFNCVGTHLLALRRRLPPVLYEITSNHPVAEFDHQEYYNSCTMKSCCFAGERDQYVLSGSDDFKLYVWKIPDVTNSRKGVWVNKAHLVLRGHRSIVNQVRYNNTYGILASSGVEKIVKLWCSFSMTHAEDTSNYLSNKDLLRKVYSHEEYINLVLESGQFMTHDYSHHSVQEDPRMMAFFDSLVQRDIEGWTSDSSDTDLLNTCFELRSASSLSSSSSSSDDETQQKVERNEHKRDNASRSGIVLQDTAADLTYATQSSLTNGQIQRGPPNTEDNDDFTLDRISQLIAQKRREQMLRTARAKLSERNNKLVKKRLKLMKNHIESSQVPLTNLGNVENCSVNIGDNGSLRKSKAELSLLMKAKDKRKLLQKKRAKLNKDSTLEINSSDSEDSSKESTNVKIHDKNETGSGNEEENNEISNLNEESGTVPVNSCAINNETSNSNGLDTVLLNSTSNGLNGADASAVVTNANLVYFPSKSVKHSKRNYRKKSAEDLEDD